VHDMKTVESSTCATARPSARSTTWAGRLYYPRGPFDDHALAEDQPSWASTTRRCSAGCLVSTGRTWWSCGTRESYERNEEQGTRNMAEQGHVKPCSLFLGTAVNLPLPLAGTVLG
jgi:hypothetical protein